MSGDVLRNYQLDQAPFKESTIDLRSAYKTGLMLGRKGKFECRQGKDYSPPVIIGPFCVSFASFITPKEVARMWTLYGWLRDGVYIHVTIRMKMENNHPIVRGLSTKAWIVIPALKEVL